MLVVSKSTLNSLNGYYTLDNPEAKTELTLINFDTGKIKRIYVENIIGDKAILGHGCFCLKNV